MYVRMYIYIYTNIIIYIYTLSTLGDKSLPRSLSAKKTPCLIGHAQRQALTTHMDNGGLALQDQEVGNRQKALLVASTNVTFVHRYERNKKLRT